MDLSIVIVSFNTKKILKDCLESIFQNKFKGSLEIIVVDNNSLDDSSLMVEKEFKEVILIENKKNLGFAKAVNQGIKKSKGEFVLLLNSDIIVKQDALNLIYNFVKYKNDLGVVGGRLLNKEGSIQGSCYHLPTLWRTIIKSESLLKYAPQGQEPTEVESVIGAVFLIPRGIINKIGLLDERYFIYFEDLDYCRRIRNAGFKVFYLPKAEFIHLHGTSGKNIPQKTHQWLVESSKLYYGVFNYHLITSILWIKQKWQRVLKTCLRGKID